MSAIKGGRLAAGDRGTPITLAISDVVGDDLSVIGIGTDGRGREHVSPTRFACCDDYGGRQRLPAASGRASRGRGARRNARDAETASMVVWRGRHRGHRQPPRRDGRCGARGARPRLHVVQLDEPVVGEARDGRRSHVIAAAGAASGQPPCLPRIERRDDGACHRAADGAAGTRNSRWPLVDAASAGHPSPRARERRHRRHRRAHRRGRCGG